MQFRYYLTDRPRFEHWIEMAEFSGFKARKMAEIYGVSLRTLERYFEEDLARKPQEWLNEQRMITALEMLESGKSIKETAADLGFKQTTHFHREYKRVHGVTPSIFKRHTAVAGRK